MRNGQDTASIVDDQHEHGDLSKPEGQIGEEGGIENAIRLFGIISPNRDCQESIHRTRYTVRDQVDVLRHDPSDGDEAISGASQMVNQVWNQPNTNRHL